MNLIREIMKSLFRNNWVNLNFGIWLIAGIVTMVIGDSQPMYYAGEATFWTGLGYFFYKA